jgi:hypothetical protein
MFNNEKTFLSILVICSLLGGNAFADVEKLPEGTTVNSLIKAGYKLFSTESVATPDAYGDDYRRTTGFFGMIYHLTKGKELVSCTFSEGKTVCFKP